MESSFNFGDRDTICAIVGGITIMSTDENRIPKDWIESVEKFETSEFIKKKTEGNNG